MTHKPHSPSSLMTYKNCPRQYKKLYIDHHKRSVNAEQERGSLVHRWIDEKIKGKEPNFLPSDTTQAQLDEIVEFLSGLSTADYYFSESKFGIKRSQTGFAYCEFDDSDCWLHGIIDLLAVRGKSGIILDWKTGKSYADEFQIEIYDSVLSSLLPNYSFASYFYYVDRLVGDMVKRVNVRSVSEVIQEIEQLDTKIKSDAEWRGNGSFRCAFCDFASDCEYRFEKKKDKLKGQKGFFLG